MRYRETLNESERPKVEEKCPTCKCGDSAYKVCFKQNTNTGTIHIFCCKCEEVHLLGCIETHTPKCLCDCINRVGHSNFRLLTFKGKECFSLEEARLIAAELLNKNYNVCGVCVSALYHNGL